MGRKKSFASFQRVDQHRRRFFCTFIPTRPRLARMRSMTHARLRANWGGIPSPIQHWLDAMLRAGVERVRHAAVVVRMALLLLSRACHADAKPERLPEEQGGPTKGKTPQRKADRRSPVIRIRTAPNAATYRVARDSIPAHPDPGLRRNKLQTGSRERGLAATRPRNLSGRITPRPPRRLSHARFAPS
jgi:hypothetical protein